MPNSTLTTENVAVQQQNDGSSSSGAARKVPLYNKLQRQRSKCLKSGNTFPIFDFCAGLFRKPGPNSEQPAKTESQGGSEPEETPTPASLDTPDTSRVRGYENEELWLVRRLLKPDEGDLKTIGIMGMPEVGKTALARLVFENDYVKQHFLPRIWVSVSKIRAESNQETQKQKVVEAILRELDMDGQMIEKFEKLGLAALLYALHLKLAGKRYLIVLDGVRKEDGCCKNLKSPGKDEKQNEEFSFGFPKGSGGAVIVTSRSKDAAVEMVGDDNNLHIPLPISDHDSCFSIYNSALKKPVPEESLQAGDLKKELTNKSGGLPVAAILMAKIKNEKEKGQNAGSVQQQDHRKDEEDYEFVQKQDLREDEGK